MVSSHPLSTGCQQQGGSSMNGPHVVRAGVMMDDAHSDRTACTRQPPCRPCPAKMSLVPVHLSRGLPTLWVPVHPIPLGSWEACMPPMHPLHPMYTPFRMRLFRVALVRVHGGSPVNRWLPCMPSTRYFLAYRWTSMHRTWRPVLQRMCDRGRHVPVQTCWCRADTARPSVCHALVGGLCPSTARPLPPTGQW
jgi:hypothetical protein